MVQLRKVSSLKWKDSNLVEKRLSRAFVLGAGLGTRLRPLTERRPKPLVPVCNKPLITYAFDHVIAAGVEEILVNTHHFAECYDEVIEDGYYRGRRVIRRHERQLLDTGGGISNIRDLAGDEDLLVYNGDILTDLPLQRLMERHFESGCYATLALRSEGGPLQVSLDEDAGLITDIRGALGRSGTRQCLFSGIYVVSAEMMRRIPEGEPVSIVKVWLEMLRSGEGRVGGIVIDEGRWWDVGTIEQYLAVHRFFHTHGYWPAYVGNGGMPPVVAKSSEVAEGVRLVGATYLDEGARVCAGAELSDCVVWAGGVVEAGARLSNVVVLDGACASGEATGGVFGRSTFVADTSIEKFLEECAQAIWPEEAVKGLKVRQLDKGGSDRSFFVVEMGERPPVVALHYVGEQAEENARYVRVAQFLAGLGVHVPEIYAHDEENGLVWMEYLGVEDLWSYRHVTPAEKLALYRAVLDEAIKLHAGSIQLGGRVSELRLHDGFDERLYRWEQEYFFERCLGGVFGMEAARLAAAKRDCGLVAAAAELASHPRVLVHRDFQSQNIMVREGRPYLIDFQGMREGLAFYDVASLLLDPYAGLAEDEQDGLLDYYIEAGRRAGVPMPRDWRRCYDLCAAQRLMQALGAYGFLGLVKGRRSFLRYVRPAMRSLRRVLARIPELGTIHLLVRDFIE